jgi:hypothetical protein
MAQLPTLSRESVTWDFAVGFGGSHAAAIAEANGALADGYQAVLDRYNGIGAAIGWEDYLASLSALPALRAMSGDGGQLLHASALVLKALEDKTHGALIASLSIPWGDVPPARIPRPHCAVWPRDLSVRHGLLALGDTDPVVAFEYLEQVQVGEDARHAATGWFLQKTHVDGTPNGCGCRWTRGDAAHVAAPRQAGCSAKPRSPTGTGGCSSRPPSSWRTAATSASAATAIGSSRPGPGSSAGRSRRATRPRPGRGDRRLRSSDRAAGRRSGAAAWYEQQADLPAANVERRMVTTTAPAARPMVATICASRPIWTRTTAMRSRRLTAPAPMSGQR